MNAGEEILEEIPRGALGIERRQAQEGVGEVGLLRTGVLGERGLEVLDLVAQRGGVGQETVGDTQGLADQAGDGVVRAGPVVDQAEDEGGCRMREGLDVVGLEDHLGGKMPGDLGGDVGGRGEPVGGGDGGCGWSIPVNNSSGPKGSCCRR